MALMKSHSRMALIAISAICTLAAAGCSSAEEPPEPEENTLSSLSFEAVEAIADRFPCPSPFLATADPYYFDEVRVLVCPSKSGDGFMLRAYEDEDALAKDAESWSGLASESRQIAFGSNWLVIATRSELSDLAKSAGSELTMTSRAPEAIPLTETEDDMTMCLSALTRIVEDEVVGKQNPTADPRSFDAVFPGVAAEGDRISAEMIADSINRETLYKEIVVRDGEFKTFCARASGHDRK